MPTLPKTSLLSVLAGGPGSEREVSLRTAASIAAALRGCGYQVGEIDVRGPGFQMPEGTAAAYIAIHGTFGEDGALQEELESRGIPYTGAGPAASRLAFDKILSKHAFAAAGVPTPRHTVADRANPPAEPPIFPCVVKPPREGSSVGVHLVRDPSKWTAALADVFQFGPSALVEELIEGRELTVGILDGVALPVVEIIPKSGFYDLSNKYPWMSGAAGCDYQCPANLDEATAAAVQQAALAAHNALGIEAYSRVDVLLDAANRPFVLEVNTIPGMTETSLLPKAAAAAGISFPDLCLKILSASLQARPS